MTEQDVRAWIDENTFYSDLRRPTPDHLLYYARTRPRGADLVDDNDRHHRLIYRDGAYQLLSDGQ